MIRLGTWWKIWKEPDALSIEQSRLNFFWSEANNEDKNILSSIYDILVVFCFAGRLQLFQTRIFSLYSLTWKE